MKKIKLLTIVLITAVLIFGSVIMTACGEETPETHTHKLTAVAEKSATCTEDGYEAYWKCDGCGKMFSDENGNSEITAPVVVEATGHSGGTATCTEKAKCEVCGEEYGELAAHVYNQEAVSAEHLKSAATCTSPAVYYKSCVCGAKGTETFVSGSALAHSYTVLQHDADGHWYKCATCDATEGKEAHSGGTATCTEKAKCEVCGEEYGELAEHVYDQEVVSAEHLKSAANCTSPAVYYKSCVCGANGTETFTSGEIGDHSYTVLQHDADGHWYKCEFCDAITEKEAHGGGESTGDEKAKCEVCGEAYGDYILTLDGVTQSKWGIGMKGGNPALPNKSDNVVGNLSENLGASLTFEFTAAEAGKAQLVAAVTTRDKEYKFTDVFTVNVNDGEALVSEAVIPTTGSNQWYTTTEISLGEIDVVKGINKVVFTVATSNTAMGVNFGYIKVTDDTAVSAHVCNSVCEDCGKCTDATCEGLGCEEKCEDYVSVTYKGTEAVLGEGKNGTAKPETIRDGLMGNISGNTGATLTYTYTAASAGTVSLYVGVTQRNVELTFKDEMTVTVNGEEFAVSDSVKVPALSTNNWYDCVRIDLGDITVNEGENTITFTVTDSTMGFNFGYVMFVAAK